MGSKGVTFDGCGLTEMVAAVEAFADCILTGDLTAFSGEEIVAMMQQVETSKRRLSALDSKLIIEASDRGLPETSGAGSPVAFLRHTLHLTRHDASTRIKIAAQVGEFHQADGQLAPAVLEVTAEAYEAGDISRDHVRNIVDVMNHLPADVPVETRAETEQILVNYCCEGWPDDLPRMGREILARLDPEGTVVSDADRHRRRGIKVGRPGIDGMSWIEGWLTPQLRALLDAFLAKYARPGMCNHEDADSPQVSDALIDSTVLEAAARRDRRDAGQRTHDAFIALLQPDLDLRKLGSHRGMPVQVTLQMNLADLERGSGLATTASGVQMSINEALKMAGGTRPVLIVNDDKGIPLYLAYGQRIASSGQRFGLLARDRGCTFPGCDAPADMCAAHHVTDWVKGGPTDLDNLALVCDHHHALVNDSPNGWKTVMLGKDSPHRGRVGWIAPKALDPTGTPQVNEKHHAGQRVATAVESSCREWGSTAA
ncbi:HNH endonuclease signature motif containing protein [Nocardia sp. JMUB6875]|uniref:HNH endonuclease signature motif containing protein n=1 Tax=Nocardia sp. JMUB6875 TaxID=3158170 RepID=UPI0032E6DB0C